METAPKPFDRKKLEEAFLSYSKGLYVYAREFVGTREGAEDILHDVFVKLWERRGSIADTNIRAYLFRAVRNHCLNHLSNSKMRSVHNEALIRERQELIAEIDFFIDGDMHKIIGDALEALPPQQRKVFTMSKLQWMSSSEIALVLDISPRTVDKHMQLAVRTLREYLSHVAYYLF